MRSGTAHGCSLLLLLLLLLLPALTQMQMPQAEGTGIVRYCGLIASPQSIQQKLQLQLCARTSSHLSTGARWSFV
jgi:hypothetical protein